MGGIRIGGRSAAAQEAEKVKISLGPLDRREESATGLASLDRKIELTFFSGSRIRSSAQDLTWYRELGGRPREALLPSLVAPEEPIVEVEKVRVRGRGAVEVEAG